MQLDPILIWPKNSGKYEHMGRMEALTYAFLS